MWKKPNIEIYIFDKSKGISQHFSDPSQACSKDSPQTAVQRLMLAPEKQGISVLSWFQKQKTEASVQPEKDLC